MGEETLPLKAALIPLCFIYHSVDIISSVTIEKRLWKIEDYALSHSVMLDALGATAAVLYWQQIRTDVCVSVCVLHPVAKNGFT